MTWVLVVIGFALASFLGIAALRAARRERGTPGRHADGDSGGGWRFTGGSGGLDDHGHSITTTTETATSAAMRARGIVGEETAAGATAAAGTSPRLGRARGRPS